jgi:hypothetical protein
MKKMQNGYLKILPWLFFIVLCPSMTGLAQVSGYRLQQADSLFVEKRYTQSFDRYTEILKNREYTPAMLLKMAYIQEGLDHIGKALYYLNLYYLVTQDQTALTKMEELASKHNLEGYKATDTDRFLGWYHDYHFFVTGALGAILIFLVSLTFYRKTRLKRRPVGSFITLILLLLVFFVHVNYGEIISTGIVADPNTYVMSGPSAGASVVEIVDAGHRVEVIGKKDVWLKIRWNGDVAYVKENHLLPVTL